MKKQLALLTAPVFMLATAGTAVADFDFGCLTPYVGVDAQMRHMGFHKRFGGNVLKTTHPQGNFFAGLKFNDCVGIELGYEVSTKKSRSRTLNNADTLFGGPLEQSTQALTVTNSIHASSKIHGWNLNLVGYYPLPVCDDNLSLIGSVGFAQLKLRTHGALRIRGVDAVTRTTLVDQTVSVGRSHKSKAVLRLAGGAQYMMTECFGVRALVTWENTSKFKNHHRRNTTNLRLVKPKNSFIYGLGVFAQL